ncbi:MULTISPECIES: HAD family hydrolase [Bacillota]|jgi:Cof subfamily protein (haloacid dehalogenase superfamily)|uniref:Cof-type HAD-IIB family hydrolase n=1 Tax=Amedibacillus hominis TaxID=2897776 RepID=A0ABS9RB55_9FIRM|nr:MULTISPECIES: HAD family hydrolase [Bacillota]MCH4286101.1 Cof-type HAD-IIB family hydrolase [Amedibacillus hominis]RGB53391.1 HAD family phosphatase [Absiella sp. AM22-9]RGB59204.1 HAD family phosphatase [Absiella sp. AM10-20]RGB67458.1 HAD family phosphatase [Absiella sp. AM09-45]RGB76857.1 HAD family phosphatase [Absiella sp. AM09-50]
MKDIRIVFSDLDGTIVGDDNKISCATISIIKDLKEKGIPFIPCTGRSYTDMRSAFPDDLHVPAILLNGALFCDENGETLKKKAFSREQMIRICEEIKSYGLPITLFAKNCIYLYGNVAMINACVQSFFPDNGPMYTGTTYHIDDISMIHEDIMKIESVSLYQDVRLSCMETLRKHEDLLVSSALSFNLEVTPKEIHKASMIKEVLDDYQIEESKACMFGDSDNDIQIFQNFTNVIAVENASKHIKDLAKEIIPSCEEDGVAKYLYKHIQ